MKSDADDMALFDRLPEWAREVLRNSDRKFTAAEFLPAIEAGGITPHNIKNVISSIENAARQRERRMRHY